jgi:hypothetical protein
MNFKLRHNATEVASDGMLITTQIGVILGDRETKVQRDLLVANASNAGFQRYELAEESAKNGVALLGPLRL